MSTRATVFSRQLIFALCSAAWCFVSPLTKKVKSFLVRLFGGWFVIKYKGHQFPLIVPLLAFVLPGWQGQTYSSDI